MEVYQEAPINKEGSMETRLQVPYEPPHHLHRDKKIELIYSHQNKDGLHVWMCPVPRCRGEITNYIPRILVKDESVTPPTASKGGTSPNTGCLIWLVILLLPFFVVACGIAALLGQ